MSGARARPELDSRTRAAPRPPAHRSARALRTLAAPRDRQGPRPRHSNSNSPPQSNSNPRRFQGIAISCLRVAFTHSRDARGRRDLSKPAVWADVCDGAASPGDVSAACRLVTKLLKGRPAARSGDTAKLALRRLWYQMLEAGYMTVGKVYGERRRNGFRSRLR